VAVREGDERRGEGEPRATPDVEADVEFGDLDRGFFACDGNPLDAVWREIEEAFLGASNGLAG
jgi:hypothetical protein